MPKRFPEETKQRTTRLVLGHLDEYPTLTAACQSVGDRLGIGKESLRRCVRQAQVDAEEREGVASSENERIKQFERKNRVLREADAILKGVEAWRRMMFALRSSRTSRSSSANRAASSLVVPGRVHSSVSAFCTHIRSASG